MMAGKTFDRSPILVMTLLFALMCARFLRVSAVRKIHRVVDPNAGETTDQRGVGGSDTPPHLLADEIPEGILRDDALACQNGRIFSIRLPAKPPKKHSLHHVKLNSSGVEQLYVEIADEQRQFILFPPAGPADEHWLLLHRKASPQGQDGPWLERRLFQLGRRHPCDFDQRQGVEGVGTTNGETDVAVTLAPGALAAATVAQGAPTPATLAQPAASRAALAIRHAADDSGDRRKRSGRSPPGAAPRAASAKPNARASSSEAELAAVQAQVEAEAELDEILRLVLRSRLGRRARAARRTSAWAKKAQTRWRAGAGATAGASDAVELYEALLLGLRSRVQRRTNAARGAAAAHLLGALADPAESVAKGASAADAGAVVAGAQASAAGSPAADVRAESAEAEEDDLDLEEIIRLILRSRIGRRTRAARRASAWTASLVAKARARARARGAVPGVGPLTGTEASVADGGRATPPRLLEALELAVESRLAPRAKAAGRVSAWVSAMEPKVRRDVAEEEGEEEGQTAATMGEGGTFLAGLDARYARRAEAASTAMEYLSKLTARRDDDEGEEEQDRLTAAAMGEGGTFLAGLDSRYARRAEVANTAVEYLSKLKAGRHEAEEEEDDGQAAAVMREGDHLLAGLDARYARRAEAANAAVDYLSKLVDRPSDGTESTSASSSRADVASDAERNPPESDGAPKPREAEEDDASGVAGIRTRVAGQAASGGGSSPARQAADAIAASPEGMRQLEAGTENQGDFLQDLLRARVSRRAHAHEKMTAWLSNMVRGDDSSAKVDEVRPSEEELIMARRARRATVSRIASE